MKVFVDMDGVLTDFVGGALRVLNATHVPQSDIRWDFHEQLGITADAMWGAIDTAGEDFWANLEWTAEGRDILGVVEKCFGTENVCLLSSPSKHPSSAAGKLRWINEHVPHLSRQFILAPAKHFLSGPGRLLIDDHDVNCDKFEQHGGQAWLVPRPWNRLRHAAGVFTSLRAYIERLRQEGLVEV